MAGPAGRSQRVQDEGRGSRVDVLTNDSDLLHGLEILPRRVRIRRPGGEETVWLGEIFAKLPRFLLYIACGVPPSRSEKIASRECLAGGRTVENEGCNEKRNEERQFTL